MSDSRSYWISGLLVSLFLAVASPPSPVFAQTTVLLESTGMEFDLAMSGRPHFLNGHSSYILGHSQPSYYMKIMDLVSRKGIQNRIELSSSQKQLLNELKKNLTRANQKNYAAYPELETGNIEGENRKRINAELNRKYNALKEDSEKRFIESLIPFQLKSIRQVQFRDAIRQRGLSWTLSHPPFQSRIETTKDQAAELKKIRDESEKRIQEKIREMRQQAKDRMLKVLEAKQRKRLSDLDGDQSLSGSIKL